MKTKMGLLFVCLGLTLEASGCSTAASTTANGLSIYTSFYPVYDFTSRILKNHGTVTNITPAGSEPHDYELTSADLKGMESADAIFVNGLNLEPWYSSLTSSLANKSFVVTSGITTRKIEEAIDPHVWLNPLNAIQELANIKNEIITLDPDNAADYENNYWDAMTLFSSLDATFATMANQFTNKHIVVSHAAFGYLCDHYEMTQIYVDGLSPDDEPSASDIARIIAAVKTYNITTIFYEELVSPEISQKIADETGAKTDVLNPLEGLSADELKTEDYSSVMIDNFHKLAGACIS